MSGSLEHCRRRPVGTLLAAAAVLAASMVPAAHAATPDPVVRYGFGEAGGTVVGDTGSGPALDLAINDPDAVTWVDQGLRIDRATTIGSAAPATKVIDAVTGSDQVTVEVWAAAANTTQDGPARLVSVSSSSTRRNLTVGQGQWGGRPSDTYDLRLRTTDTGRNGRPDLATPSGTASTDLTHLVYTRATDGSEAVWVDGTVTATGTRTGSLSNWDPAMRLFLGNEADGSRPWLGTLCEVAIYDTALADDAITTHHEAGCPRTDSPPPPPANTPPVILPVGDQASTVGDPVGLTVTVTDADGDPTTLAVSGLPDGLALDPATGTITGTPTTASADTSPHTVTLTATDRPPTTEPATATGTFTWTIDPTDPTDPTPPPPPPDHDTTWRYPDHALRIPITVDADGTARTDRVALVDLDLAVALDGARAEFDSARVVESDAADELVDAATPFQLDPDPDDPTLATLAVLLTGDTGPADERTYHLYLDVVGGVDHQPADVQTRVGPVQQTIDEGQASYRVPTPVGTWSYDRAGGGFASLDDVDGNDWISWTPGGGSGGEYRGIPNLVHPDGHFHPGADTATTTIVADGPVRVAFESTTDDGWAIRWNLFPTHSTATVLAAPEPYWFLYEGTPGGELDRADTVTRSGGTTTAWDQRWSEDLDAPEWAQFTDPDLGRSLFMTAHDDDDAIDSYRAMNGEMTVFGLGRDGLTSQLDGTERSFSVGLADDVDAQSVAASARAPLAVAVGPATTNDGGGGGDPPSRPPVASAVATPRTGTAPLDVHLDASGSSDPDGSTLTFTWDLGDGTSAAGAEVDHRYPAGDWTARVTVTDEDGRAATASTTIRAIDEDTQRATDGLLAEYRFDEVDGTLVADVSGNQPPVDLRIAQPERVTRSRGALRLDQPTIVASDGPATTITDAIRTSNELTTEAWIATSDLSQNGPARIVTLSDGSLDRDLTLGQGVYGKASDQLTARIRTSATGTNGATVATGAGSLDTDLTHVVVTRAVDGVATVWMDGRKVTTEQVAGDLGGWKDMRFGLGNEFGASRPWLGTYFLVSLYDRALDADEVQQNFAAGPGGDGVPPNLPPTVVVSTRGETGPAPRAVTFDASASTDPDGSVASWRWDFGDGSTGSGATVQHTYLAPGTYTAEVVVSDDLGLAARRAVTVVVTATGGGGGGGGGEVTWTHLSTASGDLEVPNTELSQQVSALPGDLDGDGDVDFVIAARKGDAGPSLVWYERRPAGWDRHVIEPELLSLEAGGVLHDIDGDGDLDLVVGTGNTGKQMWWWDNPGSTATWTRRLIKDGGANQHHDQAFGDVDGDGIDELVYWNNGGPGTLYLAEVPADPTVEPWPATAIFTPSQQSEGLVITDLDGDGTDDIVGGGFWFEYAGGRDFVPHEIDASQAFTRTAVADLVEGGRPEVVFDSGDTVGQLRLYEWNGTDWVGRSLLPGGSDHGHSLQVGDVDRDGHVDVMSGEMTLGGNDDAALRVLYGDGAGSFRVEEVSSGYDNHESKLADLDADGDLDILGKPFNDGTPGLDLWINEAAPPGLDDWDRTVVDGSVPWRTVFVEHADLDGDGFDDVVSGGWWWHNPGTVSGNWQRRTIGAPLNQMATVADVDRDGDLDVLGTEAQGSESNSTLHWARNDGTGTFTIHDNIAKAEGAFLQGVTVAEFRPGVLEVALSWQQGKGGLQVLTIPDPTEVTTTTWTWRRAHPDVSGEGLDHGDIDGDGDIDLVDGGAWFRNDGTGTFARILLHDPAEGEPDRNVLADMDGDGDLDLDLAMGYGHDVEGKVA